MTRDFAVKWARHGIRVNAVAPGYFETRLSAYVTGHILAVDGGMTPM